MLLAGLVLCTAMIVVGIGMLADGDLHGGEVVIGGAALAIGIALWQRRARWEARLERLLDGLERLERGEDHVFMVEGADTVGRIGQRINALMAQRREARLDRSHDQILDQAMARESPNGLLVVDQERRVRRYNAALARLLEVPGDLIGRSVAEIPALAPLSAVLVETDRTRAAAEQPLQLGRRDLLLRGVPLADGAGCLGVVLDITSVRQAERARREFVANVSHEIRTPITAILGYTEALLEEAEGGAGEPEEDGEPEGRRGLSPQSVQMVRVVERNARRLHALVEDVLQLSKIEARTQDLPLEREPVAPLIREVVERLEGRARDQRLQVVVEAPDDLEAAVNAQAFEHALGNLVDNAIKYAPAGTEVRILARRVEAPGRAPGQVAVEVRDAGPGIAPEHHARLFERFYRVDPGRSRAVGGTGLGLALVKHLCAATRAEVQLESAPGQGSTFRLLLPTEALPVEQLPVEQGSG